jgi:hypothetical protein
MSKKRPIVDPRGQWDHPGEVTRIPSSKITMKGVSYPVLGIGDNGQSQMMYPGMDYNFGGASYVDEYPIMQAGGRAPIYTSDPNDPRLKAYRDSINSFNLNKKIPKGYVPLTPELAKGHYSGPLKNMYYHPTGSFAGTPSITYYATPEKPVQPIILQEHPMVGKSLNFGPVDFERNISSPSGGLPVGKTLQQPVSNYSLTYRDENSPSKQRTQYLPDFESWKNFTDNVGYMSRNYSGDNSSANALMYNNYKNGGYTVTRSHDRKGKTHKVTGPDGTVKYFGDSKLGQHPNDPERKKAFYARHKKNLQNNPYFRAFARATWEEGGEVNNDQEMLDGVADMLRRVKDTDNRKEIANYMMDNFRDEDVTFEPKDFLQDANVFALGGGLLSKSVTCSSCGHSWKSVDGGGDPLMCHQCGGMVKMQNGGATNLWKTNKRAWVDSVHNANLDKIDFVKRFYDQSKGSIQVPGERGTSTHLMAYDPKTRRVYPEVVNVNGKLQYMPGDLGYNYAEDHGQYITFPTAEQAKWYSTSKDTTSGYKMGTGVLRGYKQGGEMIRRADGSYSRRGLWDNIRANKGSGKKPTKEMLKQERKIKASMQDGGSFAEDYLNYLESNNNLPKNVKVPFAYSNSEYNNEQPYYKELPEINVTGKRKYDMLPEVMVKGKLPGRNYNLLPEATVIGKTKFVLPQAARDNTAAPFKLPNGRFANTSNLGLSKGGLRKMQAPAQYDFPITLNQVDVALDLLGFIPGPVGIAANVLGAGVDAYQTYDAFTNKRPIEGTINAASTLLPIVPRNTYKTLGQILETGYDAYQALDEWDKNSIAKKKARGKIPSYQSKGIVKPTPTYDAIPHPEFLEDKLKQDVKFKQTRDQRLAELRKRIYKNIRPSSYDEFSNYMRYAFDIDREDMDDPRSEEAFRMYLGLENKPKYFSKSKYAPTIKGVPGSKYYKVDDELEQDIFNSFSDKVKMNEIYPANEEFVDSYYSEGTPGLFTDKPGGKQYIALQPGDQNLFFGRPQASRARALGNFVVSRGKDKKGEYLSYSDQYDFPDFFQEKMQGKPFKIYNRIYYPKEQMGGKVAMREYPTFKNGGWLRKYQTEGEVTTPTTPIYNNLQEFLDRNKDATTYIDKKPVRILKGISKDITPGATQVDYCHPDDEQCTARANRMVSALLPGTSYFENPDITKKHFGADYSVARVPTQQEVERYPYFAGDTKYGSLDAWDIAPTVEKSNPKNVLYNVARKSKKYEDIEKNRLTYNQFIKQYDVPIGSFINTGLKHQSDEKGNPVIAGGSHTVRVVGYLPTGEPLVADYGHVRPLSQSMYTYGDKDQPFITAITSVPGKEKYNFKYFKDQKELANKPSDVTYINDFKGKSSDYKKFHDTIAKNKNYVVANLGITPEQYDEYAKIALTLGGHETEFGTGTTYKWLDWLGGSTGVAQLNESNVDNKYKKTLSKYKKGTKEYNALATVLYMNELNKYKDKWVTKGQSAQERPYKRHSIDSKVKELYRNLAQNKSSAGYINSAVDSDEYRDEKGTFELPYKTPLQSAESYKTEVNKLLSKTRPDLRFDYDKSGERVIYKKTKGNKIPNTLKDFVFYAYNTPTTVMYGDAQGDSKYYQKMNEIYTDLFGKKRDGGDISIPELYHVTNPRVKKLW